jgi:glycosyltransferase involved in cell wall biosynthesis
MIKISVVIITYNEEKNLARCLESVKNVADEIVVVDSFSKDQTATVAERFNATVINHAFSGYGEQKNFATEQASNNWILSLDADEALTPELEQHIMDVKNGPEFYAYEMPRITNYCGKWIKHCGWYPDRQTRLFDRTKGRWAEQNVHEYWKMNDSNAVKGVLRGDLQHYSFASIQEHLKKIEKYTELGAIDAIEKGKDASLAKIWLYPKWRFFVDYFIRLGFLDGFYGYIVCKLTAQATFIKYSKTRIMRRGSDNIR